MPSLYNQKVTPKLQHYIDEDESRTSLCALFFVKKGFPFVSILDGGFVQAHAWLCREGPKRHLDAESVLVDYNEDSFFGRLEKTYKTQQELANATAREKTQHALQSFLDSSMVTLTRTARYVDAELKEGYSNVPTSLSTTEEVEEEETFVGSPISGSGEDKEQGEETGESEGSFVSRFAGKLNKKSEKGAGDASETVEEKEKGTATDGAEPKFKISFAGFRKADADAESGDTEADSTTNTPMFRNPFAARRSVVPEKGEADGKAGDTVEGKEEEQVEEPDLVDVSIAPTAESNKQGTFSRLARAASSSIQKVAEHQETAQNSMKRNPFARFGGASKPVEKAAPAETKKAGSRFGGINMNNVNQLRKSTLSNLRAKASEKPVVEPDLVEESISFDHDNTASTPSEAPVSDKKTKTSDNSAVVESV